jgi:hypothetical protein
MRRASHCSMFSHERAARQHPSGASAPARDRGLLSVVLAAGWGGGPGSTATIVPASSALSAAATLRVVLIPANVLGSAANMLAGLRARRLRHRCGVNQLESGGTYFTKAQVTEMHSILPGATAHHVTVIASSGDNGALSDDQKRTPRLRLPLARTPPAPTGRAVRPLTWGFLGAVVSTDVSAYEPGLDCRGDGC